MPGTNYRSPINIPFSVQQSKIKCHPLATGSHSRKSCSQPDYNAELFQDAIIQSLHTTTSNCYLNCARVSQITAMFAKQFKTINNWDRM